MNKYRMSYSTFIALDGTSNQFPENSITSPLDLNTSLTITVMLRRPVNDQGLTLTQYADQIIANTAQVLTREKFLETFAVSDQDIDQVCEFAKFFGMTVIDSHTGSASVKLSATASILNRAFNVNLKQVAVDDANEYFGHAEPIGVPTELSNIIEHVLGLDSFSRPIRKSASCVVDNTDAPVVNTPNVQAAAINPNATPALHPITPIQAATAYQFPNVAGDNQCVGIVEYGGGYSKENLDKSFASVGLITPAIIDVSVNGAYNQQYSSADPDIHNYSMEVALDIFVVGCVVPNATLVMYFSDNSISHFVDPILAAINDTVNNPSVISVSWSYPELYSSVADVRVSNQVYAQAVALGITICCSTGDFGAFSDKQTLSVNRPASSPYVLAVGGTSLILNDNNTIYSENAWPGSGGGYSSFETTPRWQQNLNLSSRGIPDVSANADSHSGYSYYTSYYFDPFQLSSTLIVAGGTSASAPLIAGLVARLNQKFGKRIKSINQSFYANSSAFNDITVGNNDYYGNTGYASTTGWDPVTGLGSPKGLALEVALVTTPSIDNIYVSVVEKTTAIILLALPLGVTSINIVRQPLHGTAYLDTTTLGIIYYTPSTNYYGNDDILVTVSTPLATSNAAFISINVVSALPVVTDIQGVVVPPGSVRYQIKTAGHVKNYYDTIRAVPFVVNGVVQTRGTIDTFGTLDIYYTPPINYSGPDQFQYYASSPTGDSNLATVYISVPEPGIPVAYNIKRFVIYNSLNNFITPNVKNYYSSLTIPTLSSNGGGVGVLANHTILYNPPINYVGTDSFSYTVANGSGISTATVSIIVLSTASAVVAYDISLFVLENTKNNYVTPSSTNSPASNNGIAIVNSASHGLAYVTNNAIYYTPNQNYVGFDQFSYKITNIYGTSSNANIYISVNSVQYTPVAVESSATVYENSINNQLVPIIRNSATSLIINSQPNFGVAVASTSTISYTPTAGFTGIDYFYFSGYNTSGISKPEKFYITVVPLLSPVAYSTSTTVLYNSLNNAVFPTVQFPFNSITIVTKPLHGVTTSSNTVIYYTPKLGYSGTDTFTFIVGNAAGSSKPARVGVKITPSPSLIASITGINLPKGAINVAYTPLTIQAINGTSPYTTVITNLINYPLPVGMTLTNNVLSGTPGINSAGLYPLSFTITDSSSPTPLVTTTNYILDIATSLNKLITASSFNDVQSNCYTLLTTTYGAVCKSSTATSNQLIIPREWNNLYDDILRCSIHQSGVVSKLPNIVKVSTGNFISLGELDALSAQISKLQSAFLLVDPGQLLLDNAGTISQSTSTLITKTYIVTYDWPTSNQANIFFSLGGYIRGTLQNPSSGEISELVFGYNNYINNDILTNVSDVSVLNGNGTIGIQNKNSLAGSSVVATFQINTSTQGVYAQTLFTATDYYSTGATGGIEAPRPLVQLSSLSSQVNAASIGTITVTGNAITTATLTLTNNSLNLVTILSSDISCQSAVPGMPLAVTYPNSPLTIASNSTATLRISLQNFTAVGGSYPTTFNINAYATISSVRVLLNTLVIPVQININYGIVVYPPVLSGTVTAPTTYNFTVTGYGGLQTEAVITPGGFNDFVPGVIYSNPDPTAPLVAYFSDLVFDPYYMPNGPYFDQAQNIGFTVSSYTNRQFAIVRLDTTNLIINVTDRNLGSWLSPYDSNNAIMGFSYDILNGVPTLTMGFGSVPAMNAGGYVTYSANSLKSLGRSRYLHYTNYIGGVPVISAFDYQKSCNPEYSSFLNTHGVWSTSDLNSASVAGNAVFYVRYATTFQWQFSVDNYGSFYIDGSLIYTYSGSDSNNFRSVQSGNIALTTGSHTVTWDCGNSGGPGAFGISLTYLSGNCITYDVWSTLDLCNTSWAEITRIPLINDGNRKIYTTLPVLSHTDIYPTPYASYFSGGYGYPGMCTVVNDGFGNLQISVNILSRTSGNPNIDTTLNNVSDLLYYYSGAASRVANISAPIGINQTLVFDGFNANGTVQTRILLAPTG